MSKYTYAVRIRPRVTIHTVPAKTAAAAAAIAAAWAREGYAVSITARPEPRKK